MKKLIAWVIIIISVSFLLPAVLTQKFSFVESSAESTEEIKQEYTYQNYGKVKLLHTQTGQIEELDMDEYLLGVVCSEMPVDYELEALTYTVYLIQNGGKHEGADICDSSNCCQAWISKEKRFERWEEAKREENWGKIKSAVNSTKGKVIKYDGKIIKAFFHANSGGKTENVSAVWGGADLPYLQSVETSGENNYSQYSSEIEISKAEFETKIKRTHPEFTIKNEEENCIEIKEYTSGNRVKTLKIGNIEISGVELRTILGLRSANFSFEINGDNIKFFVTGYGHGVGMSQTGADSLAKQGILCEDIIKHFYTGVSIENIFV